MEENKKVYPTLEERSRDEIVSDINKVLNKLRPYLNSEGGDLEFIDFIDGIVYVRMLGACDGCGAVDYTLKDGIEALLVEYVPEVIEVRQAADADQEMEDNLKDVYGM
ncbi:MAG: NifU family protein [Acholeplasmatales bacterium]|nr:NifU family protein [Acholeplasmatales bacterium]